MRRLPPLPRFPLLLALLLPLLLFFAAPTQAERKVALVIGNGAYAHVAPLPNPANDARLMAESLKAIGFELVGGRALTDVATKDELDKAVRTFGEMIRGGGVGVFFYAGHGVQVDGKNYLIPVGADVTSRAQIKYELVDADFVLDEMNESSTKVNLVILDACRNNPFAGRGLRAVTPGLATVLAPKGTLIAYSTAPGKTASDGSGKNSPFTTALARQLRTPGQRIEDVFINVGVEVEQATGGAQSPWQSNSLRGVFCLAGTCGQQTASLAPSAPVAATAAPAAATVAPAPPPQTLPKSELAPVPTPDETKLLEAMRGQHNGFLTIKELAGPLAAKGSIYGKYGLAVLDSDTQKKRRGVLLAANQGIPLAMVDQAEFLAKSQVSSDNRAEARAWLDKALKLGEPKAKYLLGAYTVEGTLGPSDVAAGERYLAEAAREYPYYYLMVGCYYLGTKGKHMPVEQSTAKGLAFLRRSAALGNSSAMIILGGAYAQGQDVPKDFDVAIGWYTEAAHNGDTLGMTDLADLYYFDLWNDGAHKDVHKAALWYEKAIKHDDTHSMSMMAHLLREGTELPQDLPRAASLYRRASELGHSSSDTIALAQMTMLGEGVPKDMQRGMSLLKGLAEKGDTFVQKELGIMYEFGEIVPVDLGQAYFWYLVSADDYGEKDERKELVKKLPAGQRTKIEAQAAKWKAKHRKSE